MQMDTTRYKENDFKFKLNSPKLLFFNKRKYYWKSVCPQFNWPSVLLRGLGGATSKNKKLAPELELITFMANLKYQFLSSSLLKEAASLSGNIDDLVPRHVAEALKRKNLL